MRPTTRYGYAPARSHRELLIAVIGWRGRALASLMETGRGSSPQARGVAAEIEGLRERLATLEAV